MLQRTLDGRVIEPVEPVEAEESAFPGAQRQLTQQTLDAVTNQTALWKLWAGRENVNPELFRQTTLNEAWKTQPKPVAPVTDEDAHREPEPPVAEPEPPVAKPAPKPKPTPKPRGYKPKITLSSCGPASAADAVPIGRHKNGKRPIAALGRSAKNATPSRAGRVLDVSSDSE